MHLERYHRIRKQILNTKRTSDGIGTLSEKTVHAILKEYYSNGRAEQEIPLNGKIVDVFTGSKIYEIQTRSFDKLRAKFHAFMTEYPVTVVYPIPREKFIIWIDDAGTFSKPHKSPKKGSVYDLFYELYKIKMFLKNPHLSIKVVLMDVEEYRILNGWSKDKKKGSTRFDRIPLSYVEEISFECINDYVQVIPYELAEPFTVSDFSKVAKINLTTARYTVHILHELQLIYRVGKKKNAFTYCVGGEDDGRTIDD